MSDDKIYVMTDRTIQAAAIVSSALLESGEMISGAIEGFSRTYEHCTDKVCSSLDGLTDVIENNLHILNDSIVKNQLSTEYRGILQDVLRLKKDNPELKIPVDSDEIARRIFTLEPWDKATLCYVFSQNENEKVYELFKAECEDCNVTAASWLNMFCFRSGKVYPFKTKERINIKTRTIYPSEILGVCFKWNNYELVIPNNKYRIDVFNMDTNEELKSFNMFDLEELAVSIWKDYSDPYRSFELREGEKKVNTFIAFQNTKILIAYFKEQYTKAVIQVLS